MREIEKFDKVSDFEITKKGLFIWRDGKVFLGGKLIYDKNPNAVYLDNAIFFIVESNWKDSICIDLNRETKTILKGVEGMDIFLDKKSILRNKWNAEYTKSFKQKIDLDSGNIIWEVETYFGKPFLVNGYLFASLESKLFKINLNTGDFIWENNLSKKHNSYSVNGQDTPIDIQDYIGLYNDCLYVKAGSKLILGIDTSNGEEIFYYEHNGENILLNNLRLDSNKGVIFSIGSTEYFELNLTSFDSEVVPVKVDNVKPTILGSWEDNIIYFWEGGTNSNFGLFDRDTKEIKFVQNLNVSGYPAIKKINNSQGNVYVLDGNNNLHIFEQETIID